jgi:hypothetical protein
MSDGNQREERSTYAFRGLLRGRVRAAVEEFSEVAACLGEFLRAEFLWTESVRAGNTVSCLAWIERLRRLQRFVEEAWRLCSLHFGVWREPGDHKFRDEHHFELGDKRGNYDRDRAGNLYLDFGKRFDQR